MSSKVSSDQSSTSTDRLYIVVPAYNEEENAINLVEGWHPIVERFGGNGSRLLVVNDGSSDSTKEVFEALQHDYALLEVVTKENGGHGSAVLYGYQSALKNDADWVFQTDSDGQTLPSEFEGFWNGRESWDAIIGVRNRRQDGWKRKFVEKILCLILRHYFGVKLRDANAPFRLMRSETLKKHMAKLPDGYNLPNAVLTAYFVRANERVDFREVTFRPRQGGSNSINIRRIVSIGWHALADFSKLARQAD